MIRTFAKDAIDEFGIPSEIVTLSEVTNKIFSFNLDSEVFLLGKTPQEVQELFPECTVDSEIYTRLENAKMFAQTSGIFLEDLANMYDELEQQLSA